MSLYFDLTEFLTNPVTTGIQRIAGEICKYVPQRRVIPLRLYPGGYVAFSPLLISEIAKYFDNPGNAGIAEIHRLSSVENGYPLKVQDGDIVFVPEVFVEPRRLAFFRNMSDGELQHYRFFVHDLLPLTHPEYYPPDTATIFYGYFQIIRRACRCGFNSEDTRQNYYYRLRRAKPNGGVVLPLGCNSLGPRMKTPECDRPLTFTVLGTIEPRKNHHLILEAFEPLLREIEGLNLVFIGKMGWVESGFAHKVSSLAADENSGVRFYTAPGDGEIRRHVEQSRATIYASTAEGYGLPAVESLWLGTPVIASTAIPSLKRLGGKGIHYVQPMDVANLRESVLAFVDDAYANGKTQEIMSLELPTWQSFTEDVLRWCDLDSAKV